MVARHEANFFDPYVAAMDANRQMHENLARGQARATTTAAPRPVADAPVVLPIRGSVGSAPDPTPVSRLAEATRRPAWYAVRAVIGALFVLGLVLSIGPVDWVGVGLVFGMGVLALDGCLALMRLAEAILIGTVELLAELVHALVDLVKLLFWLALGGAALWLAARMAGWFLL
ncbi:hypothetical protein [Pseudoroseicyclus sp. CXY001]|uniref:hypothetical protein n=1 Tax=Pseudoroseicyclus sp. CXY001 TaxID=3242492 RepID=UPI00357095F5